MFHTKKRYKTMKTEKFAQIHVKFVGNSYEIRTSFTEPCVFTHIHSSEIRTNFT